MSLSSSIGQKPSLNVSSCEHEKSELVGLSGYNPQPRNQRGEHEVIR